MERILSLYGTDTENILEQTRPALIFFSAVLFVLTLIGVGMPLLLVLAISALLCAGYIAFTHLNLDFSLDFDLDGEEVKAAIEKDLFNA